MIGMIDNAMFKIFKINTFATVIIFWKTSHPANVILNVHLIAIIKMFTIFLTIKISNIITIINMLNVPPMQSSTINCR